MDIDKLKKDLLNYASVIMDTKSEADDRDKAMSGFKNTLVDLASVIIDPETEDDDRDKAMSGFKNTLVDLCIPEIVKSGPVDSKTLSILYISQKLIHDFYRNFGTDASFGIENIDKPEKEEFAISFAKFIKYGLEGNNSETLIINAFKTIEAYYRTVLKVETKLKDQEKINFL